MKRIIQILSFLLLASLALPAGAQTLYSDFYNIIAALFEVDPNEGRTIFLLNNIPMGGLNEGMGMAYTAVGSDISFIDSNPSASSVLENTEAAFSYNGWVHDSKINSVAYAVRFENLGFALGGKSAYLPMTEKDDLGHDVNEGYYTEFLLTGNASIRLFPGYYFYGLSVGANVKLGYRGFPDYAGDDGVVIPGSGGDQSGIGLMADIGLLSRFNFFKLYSSRRKNFSVGASFQNLGVPVKDEPLPSLFNVGVAYSPLRPFLFSADLHMPVDFVDVSKSTRPYWGLGYEMTVTDFWSLQAGLLVKGSNPRITAGATVDFPRVSLLINYTLDLLTEISAMSRISIQARFNLGDRGRADASRRVDELYVAGLDAYASGDPDGAIASWKAALAIDPSFDPARESLNTAQRTLDLQEQMLGIQRIE